MESLKKFSGSKVLWVRHGQSEYNAYRVPLVLKQLWRDEYRGKNHYLDCGITELGKNQCLNFFNTQKNLMKNIGLVITSPLYRSIQTAECIVKNIINKPQKMVVDPAFTEILNESCDFGVNIEQSIQKFKQQFDFSLMNQFKNLIAWNVEQLPYSNQYKYAMLKEIRQIVENRTILNKSKQKQEIINILLKYLRSTPQLESAYDLQAKKNKQISQIRTHFSLNRKYLQNNKDILVITHGLNLMLLFNKQISNVQLIVSDLNGKNGVIL